jgi:dTDP-glucose 4,6-dehydratase
VKYLKNNLYVISGVTGMTGNELARQIINRGETVIGFDNFFASSIDTVKDIINNSNFSFYEYDLNDISQMKKILQYVKNRKNKFNDIIYINCAAVVHTEHFYHVNSTFDTNVTGMKNFLNQAIIADADQFINCSTSEIYSMQSYPNEGGVKESDFVLLATAEHSQRTSYAAGKLITEFFMKDAVEKKLIRGCSIRFANVYSKNERFSKHIIPHIINSLYNLEKRLELLENSRINRRTFLHNYDSCTAVLALSDAVESLDGSIYNVATDEEVTIIKLVQMIAKKLDQERPAIIFNGRRSADPERRVLNTEKLRALTGWKPIISLSKGLDMCIEYIKAEENK